jgi:hypothetical protein
LKLILCRIAGLLGSTNLAPTKLDELKVKANILSSFVASKFNDALNAAGDATDSVKSVAGHATASVKSGAGVASASAGSAAGQATEGAKGVAAQAADGVDAFVQMMEETGGKIKGEL